MLLLVLITYCDSIFNNNPEFWAYSTPNLDYSNPHFCRCLLTNTFDKNFCRSIDGTSCSRQPLLGFSSLEPAPAIQQIRLPESLFLRDPVDILKQAPLPTSSTCMNLLRLPNYRSKELMRVKLIAAIESNAGFELTL